MQLLETVRTPEDAGCSSKEILRFLDAAHAAGVDFHSMLILRHGKVACRLNWAPYDDHTPHILFSLSKSFCSAAAGFAVSEGLLRWDDRVVDILPDCLPPAPSERLRKITLAHLLTMGSGLDEKSDLPPAQEQSWEKYALACEVLHEPGTHFHYNSHGTYLVSCMVQRVAGMNIRDYLMPRLFDKLEIPMPTWDLSPTGVCVGGWGLRLSTDSLARFGQCLLERGMWRGERVLPENWVERATQKQIENFENDPISDWQQGYGYQFWRTRGGRFRGDGMFGQVCMVDEARQMVVVCTAGINDMGVEMNLLNDTLFSAGALEQGTQQQQRELARRAEALAYLPPEGSAHAPVNCRISQSQQGWLQLTQKASGEPLLLQLERAEEPLHMELTLGCGAYLESTYQEDNPTAPPIRILAAYGWLGERLHLIARTPDGP
ncbi:MAG: serine hydrolase, partial [Clostridia bacterium]